MPKKSQHISVRDTKVSKEAEPFKRAAIAWVETATKSRRAASDALVKVGIYDAKGKLTAPYRR